MKFVARVNHDISLADKEIRLIPLILQYYVVCSLAKKGSSSTYTIQARDWLIITMKDNKTIEIVFLKNESRTMIIFVSDMFLKANHKT